MDVSSLKRLTSSTNNLMQYRYRGLSVEDISTLHSDQYPAPSYLRIFLTLFIWIARIRLCDDVFYDHVARVPEPVWREPKPVELDGAR